MQVSAQFPIDVTLSINGGEYLGFVRTNGKFIISAVPSGSYVLNVNHADLHFAPLRIEISQSGQYRARTLNHLRPAKVIRLTYPLELKPLQRRKYFLDREQWNIMDYLLNPMTLLMVVPLVLMLLLPLLIRDPETQREIENMQLLQIPPTMPDLTDMLTSYLANKRSPEKKKQPAIAEKPQKKKH
ncbi:CG8397 [Drosophila busckii]|uniref:CG8397 n=1 Tax=Drosophila busckii TaxID=30019 RepID=A0A0M5J6G0_DROBS|nr:ER membrane protein complex subunit 7 [Drosophila busckii]ALC39848.1 CG8397 [Drosophila busckii]